MIACGACGMIVNLYLQMDIGEHSSRFSDFSQQDSQECLTAILEMSHNDMKTFPTAERTGNIVCTMHILQRTCIYNNYMLLTFY